MDENNKQATAIGIFQNNYNCAQSVISVFADEMGLSNNLALKLASPFGAGICRTQETCGAVSGALMAIGLKYGKGENGTDEEKAKAYEVSNQFLEAFKAIHGSTRCLDLLDGLHFSIPEEMQKVDKEKMFSVRCPQYVEDAVRIAESLL
jgi:C_GCAxxG_C_C family probable redox protein